MSLIRSRRRRRPVRRRYCSVDDAFGPPPWPTLFSTDILLRVSNKPHGFGQTMTMTTTTTTTSEWSSSWSSWKKEEYVGRNHPSINQSINLVVLRYHRRDT
jgi:hypothetical protein